MPAEPRRAAPAGAARAEGVPSAPRSLAPIWFFGMLAAMLALHFSVPLFAWNLGASRWWGLPPAVGGLLLVVIGAGRFRGVTTLRPYEQPRVLVTDGLHRYSRNPMYLGLLVSALGAWIMLGTLSPGLVLPVLYWLLRTRFVAHEERVLEARFPDAYREYRRRVRRWL